MCGLVGVDGIDAHAAAGLNDRHDQGEHERQLVGQERGGPKGANRLGGHYLVVLVGVAGRWAQHQVGL